MKRRAQGKIAEIYKRLQSITAEEIERVQLERLRAVVHFHFENNPIYRNWVEEAGMSPRDIQCLADLKHLPVLDGKILTAYGNGIYSCPDEAITYLHTSGSTGMSKIVPVTASEKKTLSVNDALTAYILGVRGGPIYCTYPTGPWPSAFFAQNGAEMLGPTIRADMGLPVDWHVPVLLRFRPKVIMASPSYISYFVSELEKRGIDVGALGVEVIKLAGEPLSSGLRYGIATKLGAKVMDLYGSAEIGAASVECPHLAGSGYHHYLANELIFETQKIGSNGAPCGEGEHGELLVTSLFRYSVPIIRYNTKDIVRLTENHGRCACGLGLPVCSAVLGRSDDMLTYGGANVYPEMIYRSLAALDMDDKFQVGLEPLDDSPGNVLVIRVESDAPSTQLSRRLEMEIEKSLRQQSAELDYVFQRKLVNPIRLDLVARGDCYSGGGKLKRFMSHDKAGQNEIVTRA